MSYWSVWMSREPSDGVRVERMLAMFMSQYMGAHMKKGHTAPKPHELMLPDYWAERDEQQKRKKDVRTLVEQFTAAGVPVKFSE
jgi:hypothetical protein